MAYNGRVKVKEAMDFYIDQVLDKGYSRSEWDNIPHSKYNNIGNAFGRMYVDKFKNADMEVILKLIVTCMQDFNGVVPVYDQQFLQKVKLNIQNKKYNKTDKAIHAEKWRTTMILLDRI